MTDEPQARVSFVERHPGTVLTLIYVWLTVVGVAYISGYYGSLGVRVFDFIELNDILIAALRDWFLLLVVAVLTVVYLVMIRQIAADWGSKVALHLHPAMIPLVFLFAFPLGAAGFGALNSKGIACADDPEQVWFDSPGSKDEVVSISGVHLVGTTERFAFFIRPVFPGGFRPITGEACQKRLDEQRLPVLIVPLSRIRAIQPQGTTVFGLGEGETTPP